MMDMFYELPLKHLLFLTGGKIKYQRNGYFTQPSLHVDNKKYNLFSKWFEFDDSFIEGKILGKTLLELFVYSEGASFELKSDLPIIELNYES